MMGQKTLLKKKKRKNQINLSGKFYSMEYAMLLLDLLNKLDDFMKAHLQLKKYGRGVEFIGFIFVFEPTERDFHPNYLHYSKEYKQLTLQYRLPFEQMLQASSEENFQTIVQYFLIALETFYQADAAALNELSDPIKDFDFTAWKADVEQWLEEAGWLKREMV